MTVTTDPNAEGAAIALAGDPIIPPGGPKGGTPIGLGIPGIPIGGKGGAIPAGGMNMGGLRERFTSGMSIPTIAD
jgi:hypothetical protein